MSNPNSHLPYYCSIPGHPNNGQPISVEYAKRIYESGRLMAASTSIQPTYMTYFPRHGNPDHLHVGNKVLGFDGKIYIQYH